jgi:hypothetical protein
MKYALYDAYEADSYPGELVAESDDFAAIKLAAIAYMEDCDGECLMNLVEEEEVV